MTLTGLIWAAFAPLLLVVPVAALAFALRRLTSLKRGVAIGLASAITFGAVFGLREYDLLAFRQACRDAGAARIVARASADGFLLTSGTSNSFGMRYLHDGGFQWMESNDIYRRGGFVRYTRDANGGVATTKIDAPSARYEVRETFDAPAPGVSRSLTTVLDREGETELARAASLQFDGGATKWVLGAWGIASCPNAASDPAAFRAYYHLAKDTLRAQ